MSSRDPLAGEYPLARPYSKYARLYDELGQSEFALAVMPLVEAAAERYGVSPGRALDLACGTGTAALHLAERGWEVTAVDGAPEMLRIARQKALEAGAPVTFLRQKMERLEVDAGFGLVVCLYDSLNYLLTLADLEAAVAAVAAILSPGGVFFFDVNTIRCLAEEWSNRVVEERCSSAALIHLYSYDPGSRIGTLELVCVHNGPDRIVKFREVHRERAHTREEIEGALRRAGLHLLEEFSFPELAEPSDRSSRLVYIAMKQEPGVRRP